MLIIFVGELDELELPLGEVLLGDALLGEALVELEQLPLVPDLLPVPAPLVPLFIEGLLGFEVPCVRVEYPDVPRFCPPIPDVDCGLLWPARPWRYPFWISTRTTK